MYCIDHKIRIEISYIFLITSNEVDGRKNEVRQSTHILFFQSFGIGQHIAFSAYVDFPKEKYYF